ncbi:hypothetical protein DSM25558_2886 [Agrobacterium sp. DSM 25558]|uniref:entry exclusion protein TrbK n=1 Tax=Agrobacterium sp. DSM 25558 TaxID=1907665 RepID=UPI00097264E0|nr:entry exclusion protein TrbK [Agrobacterium sp. DSM 25558]SCX21258.1 hypothetical protein DSM25558_2886 [Agrobacterium sp. DSM 25558]
MSRAFPVALLLAVAASAATVLIVSSRNTGTPPPTQAQRAAWEGFFGSERELPPIKEGQEMRPRW